MSPAFAEPNAVRTFRLYIPETQVPASERDRVVHMEQEMVDKLAALPGVSSVGFSTAIPMDGRSSNDPIFARDRAYN